MGFFDDSYDSAESFFDAANEMDKTVDTTNLKMTIIEMEEALNNDYFCLGQLYYKKVKDGEANDTRIKIVIDEIDEKKKQIALKRKELDIEENTVICYCGAGNLADAQYCQSCGRKL